MRPKEIQEKLGIDADRIKFFKREGIFSPENPPSGNRGTNYTEEDLENLRLIVVLTKSGLTCRDIRKMQDGECSLHEAIVSRMNNIETEIARKQNALSLLSEILDDKAEFETFATEHYWDVIVRREAAGEEFVDVEDMYGYQLVQSISKLSNGVLSINTGAMYTSLYKLEEEGYITSISTKVKNRQIRIYYHLTDSGRDYREVLLSEYLEIQKAMNCLLKIEKKE